MKAKLLFLGTGGSLGIPMISCKCPVCTSDSQLNKRLRPSALLLIGQRKFLIDVGPDFRDQALRFGIDDLDGILLTHCHYDHIGGIDELRVFYFLQKKKLPVLGSDDTHDELRHRFHYLFKTKQVDGTLDSQLDFQILEGDFGKTTFQKLKVEYVTYYQANMKVTGYRFGTLAYISDIREYEPRVVDELKGTETLILSAPRIKPTKVHFSLEEAIEFSDRVGAKRTFITHIAHDLEHDKTNQELPDHVHLAHDGMEIEFNL